MQQIWIVLEAFWQHKWTLKGPLRLELSQLFTFFSHIYSLFFRILSQQTFTHFLTVIWKKIATFVNVYNEGGVWVKAVFKTCLKKKPIGPNNPTANDPKCGTTALRFPRYCNPCSTRRNTRRYWVFQQLDDTASAKCNIRPNVPKLVPITGLLFSYI